MVSVHAGHLRRRRRNTFAAADSPPGHTTTSRQRDKALCSALRGVGHTRTGVLARRPCCARARCARPLMRGSASVPDTGTRRRRRCRASCRYLRGGTFWLDAAHHHPQRHVMRPGPNPCATYALGIQLALACSYVGQSARARALFRSGRGCLQAFRYARHGGRQPPPGRRAAGHRAPRRAAYRGSMRAKKDRVQLQLRGPFLLVNRCEIAAMT